MQLNGYQWNIINKAIKYYLQIPNSDHKIKRLEPLKTFIPYQKGVAEKLKGLQANMSLQVFTKARCKWTNKDDKENKGIKWKLQDYSIK